MPLGISERKIERVYGPLDLSGVYKPLIATAQKIAADEVKRVDEAKKQLATTSAELNKLRVGVRESDLGDITRMYNRWAEVERQLANNPNLIRKNPDVYGELKNESNTLYGNMLGVINESKQQSKVELDYMKMLADPNNRNKFKENSLQVFKSNVLQAPVRVLRDNPYNDITTYYETIIDGSKFYNALPQRIESTLIKNEFESGTPDKFGQITKNKVERMPVDSVLKINIYNTLKGNLGKDVDKFSEQQLEKMINDGSYDMIVQKYNNFWDSKKNLEYNLADAAKAIDFSSRPLNSTDAFVNIMAAKEFIERLPQIQKGIPQFKSKAEEILFRERNKKEGKKEKEEDTVTVDLFGPAVSIITKTTSKPENKGKNVSLDSFSAEVQDEALNKAQELYSGIIENYDDIALNYNPRKNSLTIHTRVDIKDKEGNIKKKKGDLIGELSQSQLNKTVNKPFGIQSVRAGETKAQQTKAVPRFNMK